MPRRLAVRLVFLFAVLPAVSIGPALVAAQTAPAQPEQTLSLYGLPLKDADADAFLAAARAAGGQPLPAPAGAAAALDMRAAGVPALERLTLVSHEGKVASVRFLVKGYGQDNVALRGLLFGKYGVPMTVSPRPLPFAAFAARAAPRGGFQWAFADGMRLVYEHPRIGDVTLTYADDARLQALGVARPGALPARPPAEGLQDRF